MRRWLQEPLLYFPVGGVVLLGAYTWLNALAPGADAPSRQIRIGAPELVAVWKDPKFDPGQAAFY